jgi:hypothetical protein
LSQLQRVDEALAAAVYSAWRTAFRQAESL